MVWQHLHQRSLADSVLIVHYALKEVATLINFQGSTATKLVQTK
jgi:hypothetical protein